MSIKQALRIVLNIAMIALLLCAYNSQLARDISHILIVAIMFFLFAVHIFINRQWFITIFKGIYTPRRILLAIVNILLALTAATLLIAGIFEARLFPSFLYFEGRITIRQIHTTAAYWLLPLIGVHIGLHWGMFSKYLKKNIIIMHILAFLFFVFGVWSFFDRDMFAKMFLGFSFDYWPPEKPIILFYAQTLSIIGIYIFAVYYLLMLIALLKTGKK